MRRSLTFWFAVACCIAVILACSDKAADPEEQPVEYLFSLTVVDDSGRAVDDLWVRSMNQHIDVGRTRPRLALPATPISFTLPAASTAWLTIHNYYGDLVETLLDSVQLDAGVQTASWDNSSFISGYYQYRLLAVPDQGDTIEDLKWMILETSHDALTSIGTTNGEGQLSTNDTLLFPCLLGNPPAIVVTNPGGDSIGVITDFYDDRVTLMITDTTLGGGSMFIDTNLVVGVNSFEIVFEPVDL